MDRFSWVMVGALACALVMQLGAPVQAEESGPEDAACTPFNSYGTPKAYAESNRVVIQEHLDAGRTRGMLVSGLVICAW